MTISDRDYGITIAILLAGFTLSLYFVLVHITSDINTATILLVIWLVEIAVNVFWLWTRR